MPAPDKLAPALRIPATDRLLKLIDGMAGRPVALFADLVADRFVQGVARRISREAPVLILSHEGETLTPGGGANAIANVAALGGRPLPFGFVGDDDSGRELRQRFESWGITTEGISTRPGYRTPTKTRILGGAPHGIRQQIVRVDVEDFLELSDDELRAQLETLARLAEECAPDELRVAVLSDYGYGAVDPRIVRGLRDRLGERSTLLGDSRYRLEAFRGLDAVTPNSEEAAALLEAPLDERDAEALEIAGAELARHLDARHLLMTRGKAGMSLFPRDGGRAFHVPVHGASQVADVTGAGDTVIGTFALALAAGATPLEATCLANYAGGVVVMKMGTATLTRDELRAAVLEDPGMLEQIRQGGSA